MTYAYEIPLSNVINVSLTSNPQGLGDYNVNAIAIFANNGSFTIPELFRVYNAPQEAIKDVGSDTLLAKMITALFSPVPNFRTGSGKLFIFPFNGVDATSGGLTTADISTNLINFKSVKNGEVNFTIDGTATKFEGLDFSSVQSLADIAEIFQNQNPDMDISVDESGTKLVFASRMLGTDSTITIAEISGGSGTDLYGADYLNGATAQSTTGTNASGQTLAEAVIAAEEQAYFGGILTTQFADNDTALANATTLEALDHVYFEVMTSHNNISVLGKNIKAAGLGKTRLLSYAMGKEAAKVAIAAYATIALSVNFNATATANTMNLKTLTGSLPDTFLNSTYVNAAAQNGVDIYGNLRGVSVVRSNDNNGYTDDSVNKLWLKKKLEVNGFNYLRQTNTKIPQTETGMTGLKSAYEQVCVMAVNNGIVAPGTWNGAIPFGNPDDFKRNIEERGYYIYSLPISQQSQTDREARKAPVVQIALKFAGAIHSSEVIVNIER